MRNRRSTRCVTGAAALGVLSALVARSASAQDGAAAPVPPAPPPATALDDAVEELLGAEEVVVTARRAPTVPLEWPGGRTLLGPDVMREAGQAQLVDVLRRVPGVTVEEEAGNDTKPNIGLRGIRSERTNETTVLVDGIPLSPAPYGHPGLSLFPFVMERAWAVDVIRSGYSTRYGPNNVVGVINFLTPPIPAETVVEERMRFSEDDTRSWATTAGGTFGDFGILVEDVRKSSDSFRENGKYKVRSRGAKASWRTGETSRLLLQYDVYSEKSRLAGGLNDDDYEDDPYQSKQPDDYFRGDQQRGNARWIWEPDADTRLELLGYGYGSFREFWLGSPTQYDDAPTRFQLTPRRMTTAAFAPTFTKKFRVVEQVENTLAAGTRFQRELVHTRTERLTVSSGVREETADQVHEYETLATWFEDTVRVWDRVSLTGGLRLESIDVDGHDRILGTDVSEDVSETLTSLAAAVDVVPGVSLFATTHEGFRPPSYSQIVPSAEYEPLEMETSESWDVGVRARLGDGALEAEVTRFDIDFENRYITDPDDPDHQINAGEQVHEGWEIAASSDLGRVDERLTGFRVYVSGTFLDTEQVTGDYAGNDLPDAPRRSFAWGVGYRHASGLRAGIDGTYVGRSYGDASNEHTPDATGAVGINPSRTVWSARVGYDTVLDDAGRWGVGIEVGMTNLFDEEGYNRFGSRGIVPIAPQQAYVGISLSAKF